jgi:molybdopterin-guanine dinucleotide biosynthesis protein A
MQLVVLAAGHGRRYGGLKQLAAVGRNGECIMDYTARNAERCGIEGAVVVVREDIRAQIVAHVRRFWPVTMPVEFVVQSPIPGTAQAVYAARSVVDGTFVVVNADDHYGEAVAELKHHLDSAEDDAHLLVGYQLRHTVLTASPVTRGLLEVDNHDRLAMIVEHKVAVRNDEPKFEVRPLPSNEPAEISERGQMVPRLLGGEELVSMNLWGFHQRLFDHLEALLATFDPATAPRPELLLPDVVGHLIATRSDRVDVLRSSSRCVGITHPDDLDILRGEFGAAAAGVSRREMPQ